MHYCMYLNDLIPYIIIDLCIGMAKGLSVYIESLQ
jgi:hypothetical protein